MPDHRNRTESTESSEPREEPAAGPDCAYLTVKQLSRATTLSVSTLRRLFERKLIVGYQPGGPGTRIVFPRHAIEQAAQQNLDSEAEVNPPAAPSNAPQRGPRPHWLGQRGGDHPQ